MYTVAPAAVSVRQLQYITKEVKCKTLHFKAVLMLHLHVVFFNSI